MANSLKIYSDSGLTTELSTLSFEHLSDGSTGDLDAIVYVGSTASGTEFQADSNPGVDQVSISVTDSSPGAGDFEASSMALASSAGGLGAGGASLDLGVTLLSGVGNAVAVHVRAKNASGAVVASTELGLALVTTRETAV